MVWGPCWIWIWFVFQKMPAIGVAIFVRYARRGLGLADGGSQELEAGAGEEGEVS